MIRRWLWCALSAMLLSACQQHELLKGLDQYQANEVIAVLQRNNIAGEKVDHGKNGLSVSIQPSDFAAAVDLLKVYNLPPRPRIEISQLFPADSMAASPSAEKARLYSAIEQRLEQSLQTLEGIVSARVHVSYDVDNTDEAAAHQIHLSALAVYERDVDAQLLVSDIKRFLKNSFSAVEYDNISVVLSKRSPAQHSAPTPMTSADNNLSGALIFSVLIIFIGAILWYGRSTVSRLLNARGKKHE